jgi:hypothetical protein
MSARVFAIVVALFLGVFFFSGRATAADPGDWEAGNWSGNLRPKSVGCSAMYFNPRDDYSFSLNLYPPGFRTFNISDSSLVYIYFTDDGDDIDDEKGYSLFLKAKSNVTFAMGAFHTQATLVQVLIHSFEFGLPPTAVDAFTPGGAFTIQLPDGKHRYTIKVPPSQAAIANLKKCAVH